MLFFKIGGNKGLAFAKIGLQNDLGINSRTFGKDKVLYKCGSLSKRGPYLTMGRWHISICK